MTRSIPWLRVLIEGVVIVGSILLAFGIDAWWEGRQERGRWNAAQTALRTDFAETRATFERMADIDSQVSQAADSIASLLRADADSVSVPVDLLLVITRRPTPEPPMGEIKAILGSGRLELVPDPDLRRALAEWPDAVADDLNTTVQAERFVTDQLLPYLQRTVDLQSLADERITGPTDAEVMMPADRATANLMELRRMNAFRTGQGAARRRLLILLDRIEQGLAEH